MMDSGHHATQQIGVRPWKRRQEAENKSPNTTWVPRKVPLEELWGGGAGASWHNSLFPASSLRFGWVPIRRVVGHAGGNN